MYKSLANFLDFLRILFQNLAILFQKNIEFMTKRSLKFQKSANFLHLKKAP